MALGARTPLSRIWAALLVAASAAAAQAAPADPDAGQRAYAAGHFEEARQLWTVGAEAGDPQAQLGLGSLYDLGQGVARDPAAAYRWYLRAAEAGLAAAEFNIAVMRDTGDGAAQDAAEAALWYARAAAHGNRRAQYNLGQLYDAGDGVPRNPQAARTWFHAAAADLPAAASRLAAMQRGEQARPPAGEADGSGMLAAAKPVAPAEGATIPALGGVSGATGMVELVWAAPAQPVPVRFFVQLLAFDGAAPREVFATYLDETAVLAPVGQVPGHYAWRVYAVDRALRHYAASAWSRFEVGPPG